MAVKIKLKRMGKIHAPYYRIIVADARTKRDGRAIEEIGKYHPKAEPSFIEVDSARAQHWLSVGAQPTDPVRKILEITGDWQKFKGLPGTEGTLKIAEPKANKKDLFASVVAETLGAGAASQKAKARKPGARGADGDQAEVGAGTAKAGAGRPGKAPRPTRPRPTRPRPTRPRPTRPRRMPKLTPRPMEPRLTPRPTRPRLTLARRSPRLTPPRLMRLRRPGRPTLTPPRLVLRRLLRNRTAEPEVLEEALEHLVKGIVVHPDDVRVDSHGLRRGRVLEVRVHPDDLGKVIGRGGRTARALRTVIGSLAGGRYVRVDLLDVDEVR